MKKIHKLLRSFGVEMVIYAVLLSVYFLVVLHFLGGWLKELFDSDKTVYAVVTLLVMVSQALLLEMLTTFLLKFVRSKTE